MWLNKIPFLKNVDFTDRTVKAKAILLAVATAVTAGLVIFIFYAPSEPAASPSGQPTVVAPVPDMQMGEDNDALDGKTNKDIYGMINSQKQAEDLFEKPKNDSVDNPIDMMMAGEPGPAATSATAPAPAGIPQDNAAETAPTGSSQNLRQRWFDNISSGRKAADDEMETRRIKAEERRKRLDEDKRARLIAMGIDPDTGQPFNKGESSAAAQGTAAASQPTTAASAPAAKPATTEAQQPKIETETTNTVSADDDDSFGLGTTGISSLSSQKKSTEMLAIKAMFIEERKVKSGDRVQLRLCEDKGITVDGVHIPKNSLLYATVSLSDRLMIHVPSVNVNGVIVPLNLDAYDVDGLEGIYCPTSDAQQAIKDVGREAKEIITGTVSGLMRSFGARMVSTGRSATDRLGTQSYAYITSGYSFNLMNGE